jgi:hypothetical protein
VLERWVPLAHFPRLGFALKSIPATMVSKVANEDAKIFFQFLQASATLSPVPDIPGH